MATKLQTLRTELLSEQRYAAWVAAKNYSAIQTDINNPRINRIKIIGAPELTRWGVSGPLKKIVDARDDADNGVASRAWAAFFLFQREDVRLDLNPGTMDRQFFTAMLSDGTFSNTEGQALLASATEVISRGQELGLGFVRIGSIQAALEVIRG